VPRIFLLVGLTVITLSQFAPAENPGASSDAKFLDRAYVESPKNPENGQSVCSVVTTALPGKIE
jgi:hypothetical protein